MPRLLSLEVDKEYVAGQKIRKGRARILNIPIVVLNNNRRMWYKSVGIVSGVSINL